FLLWRHLYGSPPRDGNSGSPDIAAIALAERVCGAPDRDIAARLSGSRPYLWRSPFAAGSRHPLGLLQPGAHASAILYVYVPPPTCPAIRLYRRHANPVRPTPPLCEDMIFGRDKGVSSLCGPNRTECRAKVRPSTGGSILPRACNRGEQNRGAVFSRKTIST